MDELSNNLDSLQKQGVITPEQSEHIGALGRVARTDAANMAAEMHEPGIFPDSGPEELSERHTGSMRDLQSSIHDLAHDGVDQAHIDSLSCNANNILTDELAKWDKTVAPAEVRSNPEISRASPPISAPCFGPSS